MTQFSALTPARHHARDVVNTAAPALAPNLVEGLRRLKLAAMRQLAPELLRTAKTQRWAPEELLRTLVEAEIAARTPPTPAPGSRPRRSRWSRPSTSSTERGFRDLKSTIELRPVFHRLEPRIRAHVLLCWLALLLIRVAERRTGHTWPTIARELGRLHAITLTCPAGTVVQTTELTTAQSSILRTCGLAPPPRITTLDPV
jgi:hypothetical protein